MKIHEFQAIQLFKDAGIPVSAGAVALETDEAIKIAKDIGFPVVLKSQVLVGGRGKAGGIKVVKDEGELTGTFAKLRELTIKGYPVEKIFVVKAIDIQKEFYAAVTVDSLKDDVVVIASASGGVDIEDVAKTDPEKIQKYYFQGQPDIDEARWSEFVKKVFIENGGAEEVDGILRNLVKVFFQNDCSLAEINPLVIDGDGKWIAADAKINFDDNALYRHPDLQDLRDMKYEDPDELEAKENGLSFVKMEGNVGCIVNGAGLAMATMDIIKLSGGEPANFLDVGGSSSPEKVLNALKIILRRKDVKAILINIFGGITRCDDIAKGILEARKQIDLPVPMVVRLTGTNEEIAKEILLKEGIKTHSTMREAVAEVVKLANSS